MTDSLASFPLDDPGELATQLGPARDRLVVLDFDGVLSPIVDHYDQAEAAPGAIDAVRALTAVTSVAIVSGRGLADLEPRLGELPVALAGGHGAELRLTDGTEDPLVDPDSVAAALDAVEREVRALVDEEPGWFVERKLSSLAVHHRLAEDDSVDAHLPRVRALFEHHAAEPPGFSVLSGKAVAELRPVAADKGRALERLVAHEPDRRPLVVGDDVTDEDAFRAAVARGGHAVLVASEPRPTAATNRLADPDAVVAFLTALARTEA